MAAASGFSSFFLLFFLFAAVVSAADEFTHLHFYFHERILFSNNATVMLAVDVNPNSIAPGFGDIAVFHSLLREGVDPSSVLLGCSQGLFIFSDMAGSHGRVQTLIDFEFTSGEYNGSTLSLLGGLYNHEGVTERSVIGGTGRFRLARGYALSEIINTTTTTYTIEFNVYVTHQRQN